MKKKVLSILSVLMAAAMLFSALPLTAYAAQADADKIDFVDDGSLADFKENNLKDIADTGAEADDAGTGVLPVKTVNVSTWDALKEALEKDDTANAWRITLTKTIAGVIGKSDVYDFSNYVNIAIDLGKGVKYLNLNGYHIEMRNSYYASIAWDGYGNAYAESINKECLFNIGLGAELIVGDGSKSIDSNDRVAPYTSSRITYDGTLFNNCDGIDQRDIFNVNGGKLTVNSGEFGPKEHTLSHSYGKTQINGTAVTVIAGKAILNGGTFKGYGSEKYGDSTNNYQYRNAAVEVTTSYGYLDVNGGTLCGENQAYCFLIKGDATNDHVNVRAAIFKADDDSSYYTTDPGNIRSKVPGSVGMTKINQYDWKHNFFTQSGKVYSQQDFASNPFCIYYHNGETLYYSPVSEINQIDLPDQYEQSYAIDIYANDVRYNDDFVEWDGKTDVKIKLVTQDRFFPSIYPDIYYRSGFDGVSEDFTCKARLVQYISDGNQPILADNIDMTITKKLVGDDVNYSLNLMDLPASARDQIEFGNDYRVCLEFIEKRYSDGYTYKITRYAYYNFSFKKVTTLTVAKATQGYPQVGDKIWDYMYTGYSSESVKSLEPDKYTVTVEEIFSFKYFDYFPFHDVHDKFESGDKYQFHIQFKAKPGYKFDQSTTLNYNGRTLKHMAASKYHDYDGDPSFTTGFYNYDFGYFGEIKKVDVSLYGSQDDSYDAPLMHDTTPADYFYEFGSESYMYNDEYNDNNTIVRGMEWLNVTDGVTMKFYDDKFEYGKTYRLTMYLKAASGNQFANGLSRSDITFNGDGNPNGVMNVYDDNKKLTLTHTMKCDQKYKVGSVSIFGLQDKIAAGKTPVTTGLTVTDGAPYEIENYTGGDFVNGLKWYNVTDDKVMKTSEKFKGGKQYCLGVRIVPKTSCTLAREIYGALRGVRVPESSGGNLYNQDLSWGPDRSTLWFYFSIPLTYYTATFDANGGSGTMADVQVNAGDAFTFPACGFTPPEGMKFRGWRVNDDGGTLYFSGATNYTPDDDFTVQARWEPADPVIKDAYASVYAPEIGAHPDMDASSGNSAKYETYTIQWYQVTPEHDIVKTINSSDVFESNATYAVVIKFRAVNLYEFSNTTKYYINSEEAQEFAAGSGTYVKYFTTAPKEYNLWVGSTRVTDANKDDILGDGLTSFNPDNNTLKLDRFSKIDGKCTVSSYSAKIYASGFDLTVTGSYNMMFDDSLSSEVKAEAGIMVVNGNLIIDGDDLSFYGSKYGIDCTHDVTVVSGNIEAIALDGGWAGIQCDNLNINAGIQRVYVQCNSTFAAVECFNLITVDPALKMVRPENGDIYGGTVYIDSAHSDAAHEVLWEQDQGPATMIDFIELRVLDDMDPDLAPLETPKAGDKVYYYTAYSFTENIFASNLTFYDENGNPEWNAFADGKTYSAKIELSWDSSLNLKIADNVQIKIDGRDGRLETEGDAENPRYYAVIEYPTVGGGSIPIKQIELTGVPEPIAGSLFSYYSGQVKYNCKINGVKLYTSQEDAVNERNELNQMTVMQVGTYWAAYSVEADSGYGFYHEYGALAVTATANGKNSLVAVEKGKDPNTNIRVIAQLECVEPAGYMVTVNVQTYIDKNEKVTLVLKNKNTGAEITKTETPNSGNLAQFAIDSVPVGEYTMTISKKNHVTRKYDLSVTGRTEMLDAKICPIGDVDNNGRVNAADAKAAFQHGNDLKPITDSYKFACADVASPKNRVNSADAKAIFQHANEQKSLWVD